MDARQIFDMDGCKYLPGYFDKNAQIQLLSRIRACISHAPLFQPTMPKSGRPFSVRMTNCGALGWVASKEGGYRYQDRHPETQLPWPPIPDQLLRCWQDLAGENAPPEACLINYYSADARMGLHQDRDEHNFNCPVLSISLGDSALFRIGGLTRKAPTQSFRVHSGDIILLQGDSRLAFHGIDRIYCGSSKLLIEGGRFNLTMRRVNP